VTGGGVGDLLTSDQQGHIVLADSHGRVQGDQFIFNGLAQQASVVFDLTWPSYTFMQNGRSITMSYSGNSLSPSRGIVRDDHTVEYALSDGATLQWQVIGSAVNKKITIEKPDAKTNFSFSIVLSGNLAQELKDDVISIRDLQTGKVIFATQRPFLTDMAGKELQNPVQIKKISEGNYYYSYDKNGLLYPYVLDPADGPFSPTTGNDDVSTGTVPWSNPNFIFADDSGRATASLNSISTTTHYLEGTNFGFSIVNGSVISGIVVEWKKIVAPGGPATVHDNAVRIVKRGVIGSTDRSSTDWPTGAEAYTTYGSSSDLWGDTWTPSDIDAADFGSAISAVCVNCAAGASLSVNHVRITVYYTSASSATISGTVYTDEGTTTMGSGRLVGVSVNGAVEAASSSTDSGGAYSISGLTILAGDVLTLYLDNDTEKAVTVTVGTGSNQTGVDLYQNDLITRCDNSCSLSNANLNTANNNGDTDIDAIYTGTTTITTAAGKSLFIPSGHTFAPANPISVGGNFTNNGTFTNGSSTVTLTGTSTQTLKINGSSFNNLTINGSGGTYTLQDALTTVSNLTISAGTLDTKSGSNFAISVGGNWSNSGTFTARSGTLTLTSTSGAATVISGGSSFYNLTQNGSGGGGHGWDGQKERKFDDRLAADSHRHSADDRGGRA
jgi:hypothetical protein